MDAESDTKIEEESLLEPKDGIPFELLVHSYSGQLARLHEQIAILEAKENIKDQTIADLRTQVERERLMVADLTRQLESKVTTVEHNGRTTKAQKGKRNGTTSASDQAG